jgi:hypothetical protein
VAAAQIGFCARGPRTGARGAPACTTGRERPCRNCIFFCCSLWGAVTLTVAEATAMVAPRPTTIPAAAATVPITRRIMSVNARNGDGRTRTLRGRGATTRRRLARRSHPHHRRPLLPKIGKHLRTLVSGRTSNERSEGLKVCITCPDFYRK